MLKFLIFALPLDTKSPWKEVKKTHKICVANHGRFEHSEVSVCDDCSLAMINRVYSFTSEDFRTAAYQALEHVNVIATTVEDMTDHEAEAATGEDAILTAPTDDETIDEFPPWPRNSKKI